MIKEWNGNVQGEAREKLKSTSSTLFDLDKLSRKSTTAKYVVNEVGRKVGVKDCEVGRMLKRMFDLYSTEMHQKHPEVNEELNLKHLGIQEAAIITAVFPVLGLKVPSD